MRHSTLVVAALLLAMLCMASHAQAKCKSYHYADRYKSEIGVTLSDVKTVMIPMRDGVQLSTTLLFPLSSAKTFTSVIDRSPYGHSATELIADIFLLIGYVGIGQDMRGTCQSEGNFTMWRGDANDGYDTMEWIAKQSWSNQRIYQVGGSADGVASFVMSTNMSPYLKGQAILIATAAAYKTLYPGGAYRKNLLEAWLQGTVPTQADKLIADVKANEAPGSWWSPLNMTTATANVTFPVLMWAGWNDIFIDGQLIGFDRYQRNSAPEARGKSYIVVDPLGHCQAAADYYPRNLIKGRVLLPVQLAFDMFQGKTSNMSQGADKVTFYVMGAPEKNAQGGFWTSLPDWPQFTPTKYYLQQDRTLTTTPPASTGSLQYKYDPRNPVPTLGGINLMIPCGPLDQRPVEEAQRGDVLSFTSAPFDAPLAITGPVGARLYVATSANDTDFTAKFTAVSPDGTSSLLGDGIIRMRWRHGELGGSNPDYITPQQVYGVDVQMLNTSYVFSPGYRLRVSISSSNFPRFDVNYNNGANVQQQARTEPIIALQSVHMSPEYPSSLILPVVPLSALPERKFLAPNPMAPGSPAEICKLVHKQERSFGFWQSMVENNDYMTMMDVCKH